MTSNLKILRRALLLLLHDNVLKQNFITLKKKKKKLMDKLPSLGYKYN